MKLEKNVNNRLGIFFFYDKKGIVDKYVTYLLDDLTQNLKDLIIVVNGQLNQENLSLLEPYGKVIQRENKGFDVWAYKAGIESVGWDKLNQYDEFIMFNNTIMGPVYPFKETFDKMDEQDLDFWGLTKFFEIDGDPFGTVKYGYVPDHIQSHFITVRKSLFETQAFREYWQNMPMITSYGEAIGFHEAIFTKTFSDLGFTYDVSVNVDALRDMNTYPLMMMPTKLLSDYRCPIFKKRSFFHMPSDFLRNTTGQQTSELYDYLRNETSYDVDMIWDPVLRIAPMWDLVKNLNLEYTLPSDVAKMTEAEAAKQKTVFVMHCYFEDLIDESFALAAKFPESTDIFITTNSAEKQALLADKFNALPNKVDVRVIANRGRDVSSLMVGVKDVILNYDIACFAHDKKTAQINPGTVGESFAYKCFENVASSSDYVLNAIDLFAKNPRLGIASPPEPNHGVMYSTLGFEWGPNFPLTKEVHQELNLHSPISVDSPPVAPLGTMFWFRPKALKPLFYRDYEYEDFPAEPNGIDGTYLHAIERIYPYVAQSEGYYPALMMSDKFSAVEYLNLKFYLRQFNQISGNNGSGPYWEEMVHCGIESFNHNMTIPKLFKRLTKKILIVLLPQNLIIGLGKIKRKVRRIK